MTSLRATTLAALLFSGCVEHASTPAAASRDATAGFAPPDFDPDGACDDWVAATDDPLARDHGSFPELSPSACFVPVRYGEGGPIVDATPLGCGYPEASTVAALERRAAIFEVAARAFDTLDSVPVELSCELDPSVRASAATQNARTLRSLARAWASEAPLGRYPYAVVGTFGFGEAKQVASGLLGYRPGDACAKLSTAERASLDVNVVRARRAADAFHAGAAPLVTVSGGAVHSPVVEAFALTYLLACEDGVPLDRILVDPCADHTHTNVRNTGAMVVGVGGRVAYLVTDDGLQSGYLEEWTAFDLVGGSIDQRALRDFGHLVGSWRRASVGMRAGFWYTPYRFWASPRDGLGSFTCQRSRRRRDQN